MKERDETRDRFLTAIAEKLPAESIVEAHLFHPLKQGGTESGVAVLAVAEASAQPATSADAESGLAAEPADNEPLAQRASPESPERLAVYTAHYRLTQKGPDRGKWEFAIQAEADAPLVTVDKVVQGVQRRSGDAEGPQRLTGDEFRERLPKPATRSPS